MGRIESESNSGFEGNYDNDEMEVDQSEADFAIPENIRTHERIFLRKVEKLIQPLSVEKKKWQPLEELPDTICQVPITAVNPYFEFFINFWNFLIDFFPGNFLQLLKPLEYFMDCSDERILQKFMNDLSVGDVLIGEIKAWRRSQLDLVIIATDAGRARIIPPHNNQLTAICLAPKVFHKSKN